MQRVKNETALGGIIFQAWLPETEVKNERPLGGIICQALLPVVHDIRQ